MIQVYLYLAKDACILMTIIRASGDGYNMVGNFAPVQLKSNQRVLVPFCKNNFIIMQTYSDDDDVTFAHPQMIPNITKSNWKIVDLGPSNGLLLQSNRLLIPANYSLNASAGGSFSTGYVMINDHDGQIDKWYLGREYRSYSNDGRLTFNQVKALNILVQPLHGCEGSTIYHENSRQVFYTSLVETSITRTNLSLYASKDKGESWTYIKSIHPRSSAYSSMATLNDHSIAVLYEVKNDNAMTYQPDSIAFTIAYNETEKIFFE